MSPATMRLARNIYAFARTYDNYLRESFTVQQRAHSRGMDGALWTRAHELAAALCHDATPTFDDIPPRPEH